MGTEGWSVAANQIGGAVHGASVQAGSIQGGVHIHLAGGVAERPVSVEPPAGWGDLPQLPVAVRPLLRAQVRAALELPYRLPGARRPSLATVYVRQDLGSGAENTESEQQVRPAPVVDERGQLVDSSRRPIIRVAVRPPSRTVREALDGDEHVLVTGGPGQGKSTLSLRLAAEVAERWLSPDAEGAPLAEPVVPLRLTARELGVHLGLPFPEAVAHSARSEYGALLASPLDPELLAQRIAGCRWLLLVDGLDEVADSAERDRLVSVLATWASDTGSPYRIMLTTRPIEGAALAPMQRIGAARYELQPFDEEALRHFADNWFDDTDDAARFVRQVRAAHLDELVRVPLLATIAAIIFEQRTDHPLPDNQYELYESYLKYLRSAHVVPANRFDQVCQALLEHLGRVRLEVDTSLVGAAAEWVMRHLPDLTEGWQEELITYLTAVGPLVRRGGDLGFLHHSFAEHLAATAKARLLPTHFTPQHPDVAHLLHAARPDERGHHARSVLLHYTRLHPTEADHVIGWLHAGGADQHLLAARLLAGHVPGSIETVDAFLVIVRAWAMTTQYPGQEILAHASRAAHHPGITTWLAELMRAADAPWQSRVEAATALAARLRAAHSADAITVLRQVVTDGAIPAEHRLAAAEALSECGAGEREVSERGLRSVLSDPSATARECRTAAVVLAGFVGAARTDAVEALTGLLDDPWTPDADLVEIATGLVEIGVEFHERCAEIFRTILNRRTTFEAGLRDAALGLASLGAHRLTEAVSALTALVANPRVVRFERIQAAQALAELGPQHRHAAGDHLLAMSTEFGVQPHERRQLADGLAQVGLHHRAAELLRMTFADRTVHPNNLLWAARSLSELGTDYQEEAAQALRCVVEHPGSGGFERPAACAGLAALGEPFRGYAIAALRAVLADRGTYPEFRCEAAAGLARLAPEFHGEAAEHLLTIASGRADPCIRGTAWRRLRDLGTRFHVRASAELLGLIRMHGAAAWTSSRFVWIPNRSDTDDLAALAGALTSVLHDPTLSGEDRLAAAGALVGLGRRFHRTALEGAIELLGSRAVSPNMLAWNVRHFTGFGSGPRADLADALRTLAHGQHADAATVCGVAEALETLDYHADAEIITALRDIVGDESTDSDVRGDAAIALSRVVPEELSGMAAVVLRADGKRPVYQWERRVRALVALGADVVPSLHGILSHRGATRSAREVAAGILVRLSHELRGKALAELRTQARDKFLDFWERSVAIVRLAEVDPAALDDAIAYLRAVQDDESRPIFDRSEAAYQLARLNSSFAQAALTALQRFATGLEFTAGEREQAARYLTYVSPAPDMLVSLGLAVAWDPTATAEVRSDLSSWLPRHAQLEVLRSLLADRTVSLNLRMADLTTWKHPMLAAEAEAVFHDVYAAPETSLTERVNAAVGLGALSPRHIPEAARLIAPLSNAAVDASIELAKLGQPWRREVLASAGRVAADQTLPHRQRANAAKTICRLTTHPPASIVQYLRQQTHDPRTADNDRIRILYALRQIDGLDRLRQIRDDMNTPPATRWAAANRLRDHDVADRESGARVLHTIATDITSRPALRWRAARDLTMLGARGRELGIPALQAIADDNALSVTIRVAAADALGTARPDMRSEILMLLRQLQTAEQPAARIRVFDAIGRFDPTEGALALRELTADHTLNPGTRLRAAETMAKLHRDYKENAATTAREIAHDPTVPHHTRVKAARTLAHYSKLCRAEAQTLLSQLNKSWRGSTQWNN